MLLRFTFLLVLISFSALNGQTYLNASATVEERVEDLLSRMTMAEKIGQMTMGERIHVGAQGELINTYGLGAVLSAGGSAPGNTVESWINMYNQFQQQALSTRLGIPILYATDAVHGNNNLFGAVIFPHNIGLGCTRNSELVEECARITALEVAATGANWTFSPCVAIPRNERWGRTYEGFGETPELVAEMTTATVLGYQSEELGRDNRILACAKHFVADGGTANGVDQGNAVISESELRDIHLPPYLEAIKSNVGNIMVSFSSWNGSKCHGDEFLLTDLLKEELGFEGFIISDWKGINQLGDFKSAVGQSINAGVDMAMQPDDFIPFIDNLSALVSEGSVEEARIDDAVRRILSIKFQMGLFEQPLADFSLVDTVGSDAHRQLARQAVRESMVLLKNDGILPLSKNIDNVIVAGSKADDIGIQCGGWSISWQGASGDITPGTTIKEAIENVIGTNKVNFTTDVNFPEANAAVVVVGEQPYAEGAGDRAPGNRGMYLSIADKQLINALNSRRIPTVVILISGRPMLLEDVLDKSNAFVAAWLPGTEGQGIADVLFGDYNFTGNLSHSWPANESSIPINRGDANYDPLFEYGFGLSYGNTVSRREMPEKKERIDTRLYPNPFNEFILLENKEASLLQVSLHNFTGQIIRQLEVRPFETQTISAGQLSAGIYTLVIRKNDKVQVERLVKK